MNFLPSRLDLIRRLPAGAEVAEIGVLFGDFSAEILTTPVAHLYLIDPWEQQPPEVYTDTWNQYPMDEALGKVQRRFAMEIHLGRVRIIRGYSDQVAQQDRTIPPLDAAFIDGNHLKDYVLEDLRLWEKRLKPTGVLMGHDYIKHGDFGVIEAVTDFCAEGRWEIDCLTQEKDWPSFCLKRTSPTRE